MPAVGSAVPAPIWLLPNAVAKLAAMPMTSPVERISGPEDGVDAGELREREHRLLDRDVLGRHFLDRPSRAASCRPRCAPRSWPAARPVALETNGTVRDARGLTSRMKMPRPSRGTANCTFIRPRTPSSRASARAWVLIASTVSADSE